jgi:flagellar protein FliO/FliZ
MGEMYWRFVGALFVVVALIFAVAWVAKRLGLGGRLATARGQRRLAVQEVLPLDGKRKLVLLKRDGVEHLLLLGLNDDVVVETGIAAPDKSGKDFAAMLPGASS